MSDINEPDDLLGMLPYEIIAAFAARDQQIAALREGLAMFADERSWGDFDGLIVWTPVDSLPWEEARALLAPQAAEGE